MNMPESIGSASFVRPFDDLESALDPSFHFPETSLLHDSGIDGLDAASQDIMTMPSEPLSSFFNDFDLQNHHSHQVPVANTEGLQTLNPLDRWRNSPPETEAAHLTDIMNSLARSNSNSSSKSRPGSRMSGTSYRRGQKWPRNSPSVTASESTRSTASSSSASSAHSFSSDQSGSFGRFYVGEPTRRRRRRNRKASPVPNNHPGQKAQWRPYQCTFCTDTFKSKYDWTRHEKTLHLSLESWACAPFGSTYEDESTGTLRCAFCDVDNPSESHIQEHNFWGCQDKPSALRTFYRKDHLRQHLRLVHGIDNAKSSIASWKSEVKDINSRCGFCATTFTRWSDRNDHIAGHYKEGTTMKDWKGCRGFIPAVALAVDNAMPPYLIGSESTGIDPFSASRRGQAPTPTEGKASYQELEPAIIQPTPFEQLTEHLIRHVRAKQADGIPITDESIQKEARCLLYGDDDPWNQTAADNPEWLSFFKDGMGINSSATVTNAISSSICSAPVFPLPWTIKSTENMETPGESDSLEIETAALIDQWMPWAWQSPECLAEFRRFTNGVGSCSGINQALAPDPNDQS
ncbi:hypothetical protein N7526_000706 [Penicillium atrosanguineum]|nr:hypothetical protein N7526_000706 [Penicillium atrosanguineum]